MGVYSKFKSYHYVYACECALYVLLPSACLWSASSNSVNTCNLKMKIDFLHFKSLKSNAEVDNAMISDYIYHSLIKKNSGI